MGELYGLTGILDMEVVDSNSSELPRDELRNSENLGRFHWYIPKTGDYKVVVSNLSLSTRTDYIVKLWKGNWSH